MFRSWQSRVTLKLYTIRRTFYEFIVAVADERNARPWVVTRNGRLNLPNELIFISQLCH